MRNFCQRTSSHDLPCQTTRPPYSRAMSPNQETPAEIVIRTFLCIHQQNFRSISFLVECIPSTRGQRMMSVVPDQPVSSIFQIGLRFCRVQIRIDLAVDEQTGIQFGTCSHPSTLNTSSNCLSHKRPASECPYKFRSSGTTGSSIFAHDFGHVCRGRRNPYIWGVRLWNSEQFWSLLHLYLSVC